MYLKKNYILFLITYLLFTITLKAQDNVIYNMYDVPQTLLLNPANKYSCRGFIELPILSKFYFGLHNTGFGYNTIFSKDEQTNQLNFDLEKMYSNMPKTNYLWTELNTNILGFGFQVKDMYFTFNVSNNTTFRLGIPKDLLGIANGNYQNGSIVEEINLSNLGLDVLNYTSISASASKNFRDNLRIGLRAKYIMGHINLNTKRSITKWITYENLDSLSFTTDIQINSALLLANTGQAGFNSLGINQNLPSDLLGTLNQNKGFGVDIGAIYNYNDKISYNASIVDFGMIFWKTNVTQFNAKGAYTWSALDLTDTTDFGELFTNLGESVQNAFTFEPGDATKYTLMLPTKIFLGANYQLHEKILLGVVNKTMFWDKKPHTSLTFSANFKPLKFITTTFTYSLMDNTYNNLGLGLAFGKRGAQFYIAADKIPISFAKVNGIPIPYSARTYDFQFGLNIIFGCKKKVKAIEPLACPQHQKWDKELMQRQKRAELRDKQAKKKSKKISFLKFR